MNTSKEEVSKKMEEMRENDKEFDKFVGEIEKRIEQIIFSRKAPKKFLLEKNSNNINMKVEYSTSLTKEQEVDLVTYIQNKYMKLIPGNLLIIERCLFSKKYRIRSVDLCKEGMCIS